MVRLLEDGTDPDAAEETHDQEEAVVEKPISLNEQRLESVLGAVRSTGAKRVLDLGCGEGKLIAALLKEHGIDQVVGMDVSHRWLEIAAKRLHLDSMPPRQRERVELIQGSLTYRDARLSGFDAACVVEVIEHLEPSRLDSFERVLFAYATPRVVIVTTPNVEYNGHFETLPAGQWRHRDHRFEWTRDEFGRWCEWVGDRYGYSSAISGIGTDDPEVGSPTQMAVFTR
jgi:3' terminal RNA ribose 2'-O-methyltransferase Hen1